MRFFKFNHKWRRKLTNFLMTAKQIRLPISNRYETVGEEESGKTCYQVRFGRIRIMQNHLGRSTSVSIPLEHFQELTKQVKKVQRKERKKKEKEKVHR